MIKSILLPLDGSKYSEYILRHGQFFAEKFGAIIRILTVIDIRLFDWSMATGTDSFVPIMPSAEFQEESQRMQDEKAQKVVEKASEILKSSNIKFEIIKVSGIPVDEICQHAMKSDLVIMGSHGEYERWSSKLLGATVEAVTRQITKPVMLVDRNFEAVESIHCGYDRSPASNRALHLGANLAGTLEVEMEVMAVFDAEDERNAALTEADDYLKPYNIQYKLRHESGDADEMLVSASQDAPNPTLTLIGSYGHSRLKEAIIGSTTVHVMRHAKKPVLLAK